MNCFKALDSLFPTGAERLSGEVVSVQLAFDLTGLEPFSLDWKRKAWYVNASVNAFHMHRGLVREFLALTGHELSKVQSNAVKRQIALCVLNSYLSNFISRVQFHSYHIGNSKLFPGSIEGWWVVDEAGLDSREIVDDSSAALSTIVGKAVDCLSADRGRAPPK